MCCLSQIFFKSISIFRVENWWSRHYVFTNTNKTYNLNTEVGIQKYPLCVEKIFERGKTDKVVTTYLQTKPNKIYILNTKWEFENTRCG